MFQDVCLISPCDISREGLSNILRSEGFSIVGSYQHVTEVNVSEMGAKVVVLADCPTVEEQSDTVERIKAVLDTAIVVVLAERFDLKAMVDCFHSGAQGYIIKSMKSQPLIAALKLAAVGERVLPPNLVDVFDRKAKSIRSPIELESDVEDANLSPREHDVLCCLMAGYSNKVIARELSVCEATVKVHVKAILRKLKVNNRTQAAIWASTRGYSDTQVPY